MARKRRQLKKGADYHVTATINRREEIFKEKQFKQLFLQVVKDAKKKYKFSLKNFCIMDDHLHLIIKPLKKESLSRIMQWILSVFAVRFNKKMGYEGHVWKARFYSKIIHSIKQLINTFRYITENPVIGGIVKNAVDHDLNGIWFLIHEQYAILTKPEGELIKIVQEYRDKQQNHTALI